MSAAFDQQELVYARLKRQLGDSYPKDWPTVSDEMLAAVSDSHDPSDERGSFDDIFALVSNRDMNAHNADLVIDETDTGHVIPGNEGDENIPPSSVKKLHDLAEASTMFCPIMAVSNFAYKFVARKDQGLVHVNFFAGNTFWNRAWDLYYIWPQVGLGRNAIILVPQRQVEAMLKEASSKLSLRIKMPSDAEDVGLSVKFPEHPSLRPRFLGKSQRAEDITLLKKLIPSDHEVQDLVKVAYGDIAKPAEDVADDWELTMELVAKLNRNSSSSASATSDQTDSRSQKKAEKRAARESSWNATLTRAEQLLGLRWKRDRSAMALEPGPEASWEETTAWQASLEAPAKRPVSIDFAAPYKHPSEPVLLAIDVETYEKDHSKLTEIGVAMLDTRELGTLPPGKGGVHWQDKIHARHFRIKEHLHLRNGEHVDDAADNFMFDHGLGSEFISLRDVPKTMETAFKPPFCVRAHEDQAVPLLTEGLEKLQVGGGAEKRFVVLVGHGIQGDIDHLRRAGFDPSHPSKAARIIDTADLFRALTGTWEPPNLGDMLMGFDFEPWEMHNAGNDAVYTLWAMMAIAMESTTKMKV